MATILLTWNPAKEGLDTYNMSDLWPEVLRYNASGKAFKTNWSVGRHVNGIGSDDTGFFLIQGAGPRGIVARARILSEPWVSASYEDPTKWSNYVDLEILNSVRQEDSIPTDLLMSQVPGVPWKSIYQSGRIVDPASAAQIEELWGLRSAEVMPAAGDEAEYVEGAVKLVMVNRYERDPAARAACLAHHGSVCSACGLDPAAFGDLGTCVLVVHHVTPISTHKKLHVVDPVGDMRPLCSNCHAMVHSQDPPLHPDALRKKLARLR